MLQITNLFHYFAAAEPAAGSSCNLAPAGVNGFLNFPHWYQYLPGTYVHSVSKTANGVTTVISTGYCLPKISSINDIWLVVAAAVDILLRVAALAAVGFIIYGGIQFILAQGEPDKAVQARKTMINALAGLVISIAAATIVTFVAGSFK